MTQAHLIRIRIRGQAVALTRAPGQFMVTPIMSGIHLKHHRTGYFGEDRSTDLRTNLSDTDPYYAPDDGQAKNSGASQPIAVKTAIRSSGKQAVKTCSCPDIG